MPAVGWAVLQAPLSARAQAGTPTPTIYGRVYVQGVTEGMGQGANVQAQLGFGSPTAAPASWTGSRRPTTATTTV